MQYYKATIEVLVLADSETGAADNVAEALRPLTISGDFFDWRYVSPHAENHPKPHSGDGFELAEGGEWHTAAI